MPHGSVCGQERGVLRHLDPGFTIEVVLLAGVICLHQEVSL